jgi:sterol desaturase/sphingolipid hydroxylase (fatty acid hydroxylase superfamily)
LSEAHPAPAAHKRWIDRASVVAFAGLWSIAFARGAGSFFDRDALVPALPGMLAGYLLADLVAGLVHWIADRHFEPDTPWIGPLLIEPFRAHHADPLSITRHDFFEVLGNNALVTLPATLVLCVVSRPESALARFFVALGLAGTFAAVATNLFHAWAHAPRPPRLARWLQARRLILTREGHALHHRGDHDRAYCVTSGWLNPLLDGLRFFARLDAVLARALARGARPERRSAAR